MIDFIFCYALLKKQNKTKHFELSFWSFHSLRMEGTYKKAAILRVKLSECLPLCWHLNIDFRFFYDYRSPELSKLASCGNTENIKVVMGNIFSLKISQEKVSQTGFILVMLWVILHLLKRSEPSGRNEKPSDLCPCL